MPERERLDGRTTLREIFAATRATAEGELTDGEFRFWMMVRSMEGADRGCYADTEYLVAMLQKSESHVTKVRASLVRKGWLNVTQRGPKSPELRAVLPAAKGLHEDETLGLHEDETLPSAVKQGFHKGLHHSAIPPRPPNKESTGSTEKTTTEEISEQRSRYSPDQLTTIDQAIVAFRSTRKTDRLAGSIILTELRWWAKHPVDQVVEGLRIYVEKGCAAGGKSEKYARGIIRNCDDTTIARRPAPKKSGFPEMDASKTAFLAERRTQSEELAR